MAEINTGQQQGQPMVDPSQMAAAWGMGMPPGYGMPWGMPQMGMGWGGVPMGYPGMVNPFDSQSMAAMANNNPTQNNNPNQK